MSSSEEAAQRFIITPHQGIGRIYGEEEPTEVEREIQKLLRKPTSQLTPEELEFLDKHLGETHYEASGVPFLNEEGEEALLKEAEETLAKMEDYLNNEPMTNMEKARGVESAYYEDKKEEGTRFVDPDNGETEDYCIECEMDIGDMTPEQWEKHLQLGHEEEGETALLEKAEETLSRLKKEEYRDDYCQLHRKEMRDHSREELEDDIDQISRMSD